MALEHDVVVRNMRRALESHRGHVARAASSIGVSVKTMYNRLHRWPEFGDVRARIGQGGCYVWVAPEAPVLSESPDADQGGES